MKIKKNHFKTASMSLGAKGKTSRYGAADQINVPVKQDGKGFYVSVNEDIQFNAITPDPTEGEISYEMAKELMYEDSLKTLEGYGDPSTFAYYYTPEYESSSGCCEMCWHDYTEPAKMRVKVGERKVYLTPSQEKAYLKQQESL